jgi:hypothetical protein
MKELSLLGLYEMKMKATSAFNGAFDSETNFNDLHERVIAKLRTLAFQGALLISQNGPSLISSPTILGKTVSIKFPCQTTSSTLRAHCKLISEVSVFCDFLPRPFGIICKLAVLASKSTCEILTNREV